jgi:hypothetical protein
MTRYRLKDKNEKLLNIVATITENSEKQAEKIEALAASMSSSRVGLMERDTPYRRGEKEI